MAPEAELDRLYGLPPDEFTSERDELAKRLRAEGRRDEGAAVKALKKPSLPAWAVNQLSRRHERALARLLEAGETLRAAHERLVQDGERGELREAADRERALVAGLVELARPLLDEQGRASTANLERVRNTLHSAAGDEQLREELTAGRVVRDRESVGLGPLAAAAPTQKGSTKDAREQRRADTRRREIKQLRDRAADAAKELRSAEAELGRARDEAERAQSELADRQRAFDAAERKARSAEDALGASG